MSSENGSSVIAAVGLAGSAIMQMAQEAMEAMVVSEPAKSYVVHGALTVCSSGSRPGILIVPISHGVYLKNKAQLNNRDGVGGTNITSMGVCSAGKAALFPDKAERKKKGFLKTVSDFFFGSKSDEELDALAAEAITECDPSTCGIWSNCKEDTYIGKSYHRALISTATISCLKGGTISIYDDGQEIMDHMAAIAEATAPPEEVPPEAIEDGGGLWDTVKNMGAMAMGFAKDAMGIFISNSSDNKSQDNKSQDNKSQDNKSQDNKSQTKVLNPVIEAFLNTGDNRKIIDKTNKLYCLADEFDKTLSTKNKNNLVLQVIRYSKYNGGNWDTVAGVVDKDFYDYVNQNNPELIKYFENDLSIIDLYGNVVDYNHFAATLNGHTYFSKDYKSLGATQRRVDELTGWAGDFQTFMIDIDEANTFNGTDKSDYASVYNTAYNKFGASNTSFSWDDLYADIDAKNISDKKINKEKIGDILVDYYTNDYDERYSTFINDSLRHSSLYVAYVNDEMFDEKTVFKGLVYEYAQQSMYIPSIKGINDWPLTKGHEFTSEQRRAIRDAFTDVIWEQYEAENERNK